MLPVDYVLLAYSANQGRAALREISGHEEWMVNSSETLVAVRLLDQLLVDFPGAACKPGSAVELAAADRDRLLAVVYRRMYGSRVVATVSCRACSKPFDLDFELTELLNSIDAERLTGGIKRNGQGFLLPSGVRFRLPTGEDELAVAHLPAEQAEEEMLRRCLLEGELSNGVSIREAMQTIAPLLDLDLEAHCPDCSRDQVVHYDVQRYLLVAIKSEQPRLASEIHLLAISYGWRMQEILDLPRSQRRMYVALIERQHSQSAQRMHP